MIVLQKITSFLSGLFKTPRRVVQRFMADDGMTTAGALSFYFLMSVLPMTLLGLSVFGYILGSRSAAVAALTGLGKIGNAFPEGTLDIETILGDLVMGRQVIGGIGLVLLLWFSGGVFYTIEMAVNRIFRVPDKRGFLKRTLVVYSFMLFAGLILLGSIAITVMAAIVSDLSVGIFGINPAKIPLLWNIFFSLVPPALMMLMFSIIYKVGPKAKVLWKSAFGGGLLAAVLWEISRRILGWYLANVAGYNTLYGALGTLVALFIWLFYSANIFIIGAEYSAILHERRELSLAFEKKK